GNLERSAATDRMCANHGSCGRTTVHSAGEKGRRGYSSNEPLTPALSPLSGEREMTLVSVEIIRYPSASIEIILSGRSKNDLCASLSSPKGGEGRGEEAQARKPKSSD